jgi:excisionase family DNA binding protein
LLQAAVAAGARSTLESHGGNRLLTVKEVAALLRVSAATVYAPVERGELPHVRVSNAIRVVVGRADGE